MRTRVKRWSAVEQPPATRGARTSAFPPGTGATAIARDDSAAARHGMLARGSLRR